MSEQVNVLYVVRYNDKYGNGDKVNLEVIVNNENEFYEWLEVHNECRGSEPEGREEFDLIPLQHYNPNKK